MEPLGIGVVGAGRWGKNYLSTLLRITECRIAAVADSDPAVRSYIEHRYAVPTFSDLTEMLSQSILSAVIIATPDRTHFPLACQSLDAGKDTLVEKPMTRDCANAASLVSLAESRGLILAVGHTMLYHPGFCNLRTAVTRGRIGRPLRVTAIRTSFGSADKQTNVIWDLAPHDLAMTISMFGNPISARARFTEQNQDIADFELLFDQKIHAYGKVAWQTGPITRRFSMSGSHSSVLWEEKPGVAQDPNELPLTRQCRDFVACCINRTTPQSDARLGLAVIRSLDALNESARQNGQWLPVVEPACC